LSQDGAEIDFKRIGRAFCQIQRQLVGCAAKALPCQYPPVGDSLAKTNNTVACTTANPQQTLLLALQQTYSKPFFFVGQIEYRTMLMALIHKTVNCKSKTQKSQSHQNCGLSFCLQCRDRSPTEQSFCRLPQST
jgi:hypothetical protein